MRTLILFFLVSSFTFTPDLLCQQHADTGYVVTNQYDTIAGIIAITNNYKHSITCDFKPFGSEIFKHYSPNELLSYRIQQSKYYVSKQIELDSISQLVFVEYLVKGVVDLYYLKTMHSEYYFIEKDGALHTLSNDEKRYSFIKDDFDNLQAIANESEDYRHKKVETATKESNEYKRTLNYLFGTEAPHLVKKLEYTEFNHKPLIKLTKNYHNQVCSDYKCVDYTKTAKAIFTIEPHLTFSNYSTSFATIDKHYSDDVVMGGIYLGVIPIKGNNRWKLITGIDIGLSSLNFADVVIHDKPVGDIEKRAFSLNYNQILLPLIAEYSFSNKRLTPFVQIGVNTAINIKVSGYATEYDLVTSLPSGDRYAEADIQPALSKLNSGFVLGTGLQYVFNNKQFIKATFHCDRRISLSTTSSYGFTHYLGVNSLMFSLGYGFTLGK